MKLRAQKTYEFGPFYPPEAVTIVSLILLTDEEVQALETEDREETETQLFEAAGARQPYYGGPGHSFISPPSYHYHGHVARVTQSAGMDI